MAEDPGDIIWTFPAGSQAPPIQHGETVTVHQNTGAGSVECTVVSVSPADPDGPAEMRLRRTGL